MNHVASLLTRSADLRSSLIVTALSAAFGVALIHGTSYLVTMISADDIGTRDSVQLALLMVAAVFIVIAVYVGSIVTANTFATVIAGRSRSIALMRLIGSSASALRRAVAREGLIVGVVGAFIGAFAGWGCATVGIRWATATDAVPELHYVLLDPVAALPIVMVALATWAASWVGSRRVLAVSPVQATGAAQEPTRDETMRRPIRQVLAAVMFIGGSLVVAAGVMLGLVSPLGFLVAFCGGVASFSGVIAGAHLIMPPVLQGVGRMLGRSPSARLGAENAMRYPERSTRTTVGLVIGVTLVTTFAVAAQGYVDMVVAAQQLEPESYQEVDEILELTFVVFSALIGFSAVIAAFGMINNLSLSVLQRTRELGLLRALGFTARQVRGMIVAESAQLTIAAVALGLVLGIGYGWAGAQSLLGWVHGSPGWAWPSVPWVLLLLLVLGAATLTLVAAQLPARRATRVSPVMAIATE